MRFVVNLVRDDGTLVLSKVMNAATAFTWRTGPDEDVINDDGGYRLIGFTLSPHIVKRDVPAEPE